eukprot:gene6633-7326_t
MIVTPVKSRLGSSRHKVAPKIVSPGVKDVSTFSLDEEDEEDTVAVVVDKNKKHQEAEAEAEEEVEYWQEASKENDDQSQKLESKAIVSKISYLPSTAMAYKIVHKATGSLGGNGYNGAIYGELTIGSMQKVINVLKEQCKMDSQSRFLDVGAGLGKPNFHAAQDPKVRVSVGIELEEIRWQLSMQNLLFMVNHQKKEQAKLDKATTTTTAVNTIVIKEDKKNKKNSKKTAGKTSQNEEEVVEEEEEALVNIVTPIPTRERGVVNPTSQPSSRQTDPEGSVEVAVGSGGLGAGGVNFVVGDIDTADSLDPFTHIYMYDLGFPPPLQRSIAEKFHRSVHARYLISYRCPRRVIDEYGYKVRPICQINTSMFGSGENHMAYFYERIMDEEGTSTRNKLPPRKADRVTLPGRCALEEDVQVYCDPAFTKAVQLAAGPLDELADHVQEVTNAFMNAARPKRERKARQL